MKPVPVRERDQSGRDRGEELRDRSEDYAVRGRDPVLKRAKDSSRAEDSDVRDRDYALLLPLFYRIRERAALRGQTHIQQRQ